MRPAVDALSSDTGKGRALPGFQDFVLIYDAIIWAHELEVTPPSASNFTRRRGFLGGQEAPNGSPTTDSLFVSRSESDDGFLEAIDTSILPVSNA